MKKTALLFFIFLFITAIVVVPLIITSCPDNESNKKDLAREDDGWTDEDVTRITVLEYFQQLRALPASKTVMAGHNDEPNTRPGKDTDNYSSWTGKYPAMWSGDFLYQDRDAAPEGRWAMIREARRQWEMGNIIHLMFHVISVKNPSNTDVDQGSTWSTANTNIPAVGGSGPSLNDSDWADLLTEGGTLNTRWKERLKVYYPYFQYLKDYGVTVMFRPFHEMNQTFFWWGSTAANAQTRTAALYRMTKDIFDAQGYDNLVWVWNMQDLNIGSTTQSTIAAWTPFDPNTGQEKNYWDIFCVDLYEVFTYPDWMHDAATTVSGGPTGKPIGIGEVYTLPTPAQLTRQPNWVFAMPWPKDLRTTPAQMATLFEAENAVVHGMLPPFVRGDTVNKVRNPGFIALYEDESLPRAWSTSWSGTGNPLKVEHGRLVGNSPSYSFTLSQVITGLTSGTYEFSIFVKKANTTVLGPQSLTMNVYSGDDKIATKNISSIVAGLMTQNVNNTLSNDEWIDLDVNVTTSSVKIEIVGANIRNYLALSGASFRKK